MSRKNHIKIDGMLIRTDKQFRHLKNSQKEKIEECGIWIPYYEVEKYYCSKKNKYRKRYDNARANTE